MSSFPPELHEAAGHFLTCELVTIDSAGRPIVWPVTPYFHGVEDCIDVSTGLGYPKKADDAERNPRVALLFSDPTGSGLEDPPTVLVQGTARVDDRDLDANRARFERELATKLPALHAQAPPEGGGDVWDPRLDRLGRDDVTGVVAFVGPDGFPFAARVPVRADRDAHVVHIGADPVGAPIEPGPACLCAHAHAPDFSWQRSFQVRGDLAEQNGRWTLHPHRVVAGLQLPSSAVERYRVNVRKILRFRKVARERAVSRGSR